MSENESMINEFFAESMEMIQRLGQNFGKLEKNGAEIKLVDSLYRDMHTLKGSAMLLGYKPIGQVAQLLEACLDPIRTHVISPKPNLIECIYVSLDYIESLLKNLSNIQAYNALVDLKHTQIVSDILLNALLEFVPSKHSFLIAEPLNNKTNTSRSKDEMLSSASLIAKKEELNLVENVVSSDTDADDVKVEDKAHKDKKLDSKTPELGSNDLSTIRVSVSLLDKMMNLVGEMVLVRNQIIQYANQSADYQLANLSQKLSLVSSEIQEEVMKTRMQPIGNIVNKFNRLVRDLAKDLSKKIDVQIEGADTELDKTLLEAIKDPLTHLIRNSCDHGIENPKQRQQSNKSETGLIRISAKQESGYVVIEINDDGKGLDPIVIGNKAIERGLSTTEKLSSMTDKEIIQFIFAPGFSTAAQVSAVSGRGVGMDVVRTNIEKIGGTVDLSSVVGKGTCIKLKIPLTLAIIPALVVKESKLCFAIPQVNLVELVRIDVENIKSKLEFLQGQPVFRLRGELLPLASLNVVFNNIKNTDIESYLCNLKTDLNVVVLNIDNVQFGLLVDEVLDTADIVVKALPPYFKKLQIFSGAAILGNGGLALILDVFGVASKSHISSLGNNLEEERRARENVVNKMDKQELLLFHLWQKGIYAIPLCLVNRLEECNISDLEKVGTGYIIKYRNGVLPIIILDQFWNDKFTFDNVNDRISILVLSKLNKFFGLAVRNIQDIEVSENEIVELIRPQEGIYGNTIIDSKVVSVIDAFAVIDKISGFNSKASTSGIAKSTKHSKKIKVLVAEDTSFFANQFIKLFKKHDFEVHHAENGDLAYQILEKKGQGYFDLLVSDIEMPVMNGLELAKKVRSSSEFMKIPMIAVTTKFREDDQKKGLDSGFNLYLEKLNPSNLMESIDSILGSQNVK